MIYLLQDTITAAAARTPDKVAFRCGREALTYREVADGMARLAAVLWAYDVRKGDRVGIYLNRSIETVTAIFGILYAGAVYVPLDPKAPAERTRFQLMDANISVVVTNPAQHKNLARTQVQGKLLKAVVGAESFTGAETISWSEVATASATFRPPIRQLESDLAYLMYTSGSTGQPKGIMHTHASGLAFARLMVSTFGLTAEDRFGNHAPIFFDISTLAYFAAPFLGATAVLATDGHTIFPASMSALIARERITVWYSVPLALTQMLSAELLNETEHGSLRHVFYAGEPCAPKYLRQLMTALPAAEVTNLYGPAETNVCTYYRIPGPPEGEDHVPIGTVWANTDYRIKTTEGTLSNLGSGELLIRSSTTMAGYWNRPDLTEAAFWQQEGAGGINEIFYRTGDLVRTGENGEMHFLGRADNQVKVRGYRVEIDAVEARLLAHPAVREAVVLALPGAEGTLGLQAFVIADRLGETPLTAAALLTFAAEKLTWYAVPESVHFVDDLPRTGSGKVSRPALREQLAAQR